MTNKLTRLTAGLVALMTCAALATGPHPHLKLKCNSVPPLLSYNDSSARETYTHYSQVTSFAVEGDPEMLVYGGWVGDSDSFVIIRVRAFTDVGVGYSLPSALSYMLQYVTMTVDTNGTPNDYSDDTGIIHYGSPQTDSEYWTESPFGYGYMDLTLSNGTWDFSHMFQWGTIYDEHDFTGTFDFEVIWEESPQE